MRKPPVSSYVLSCGQRVAGLQKSCVVRPNFFAPARALSSMLPQWSLCSARLLRHRLRPDTVSATSRRGFAFLSEHLELEVARTTTSKVRGCLQFACREPPLHVRLSRTAPDDPLKPITARGCAPYAQNTIWWGGACNLYSRSATLCATRRGAMAPPTLANLSLAAMGTRHLHSRICPSATAHQPIILPACPFALLPTLSRCVPTCWRAHPA